MKSFANNSIEFDVREEVEASPRGYTYIMLYIIFDVNMDSRFTRKARFFSYEHKVDTTPPMMYASVVSSDSVLVVLIMEALNGLNVKCADVQNSYLNAKPKERVWLLSGKYFVLLAIRDLYFLKGLYIHGNHHSVKWLETLDSLHE